MTADQMHLTLRFIGEVDGGLFRDIREALQTIRIEPFELHIREVGFFPPRRAPELLWAGVEPSDQLSHLRDKVESTLQRVGVKREGRKFQPHVTLARLKDTSDSHVARYLSANSLFKTAPFAVEQFSLYSSFLASEGAIHTLEVNYELEVKRSPLV